MSPAKLLFGVLIVAILVLLLLALFQLHGLREDIARSSSMKLPTRFVLEEPECANKLLIAVGVQNVRVRSLSATDPLFNTDVGVPQP